MDQLDPSDRLRAAVEGKVALVTGGARGIGAGVARRLRELGAEVVLADVDQEAGRATARDLGARFVAADVSDFDAVSTMVTAAAEHFGGLDLVHLNAGVTSGCGLGEDFDLGVYRRTMGINLDGVVFGIHAALPALRGRPGAQIVATASLAGLIGLPADPFYTANKHAVVGLVRALGPTLPVEYGVRINALCPGFADTAIVEPVRDVLSDMGVPIIPVDEVVDAFCAVVADGRSGECWYVQRGRPSEPFRFRGIPGPRPG